MTKEEIQKGIREAVQKVKEKNPMAPSVTNTVTINFVANAQLAVGGSAAMVYLPDEGFIHLWSGKEYSKGECEVAAKLGDTPVFYKKDSAVRDIFEKIRKRYCN